MNSAAVHINEIVERCHQTAVQHGFWDDANDPSVTTLTLATLASRISALGADIEHVRAGMITSDVPLVETPYSPLQLVLLSKLVLIVSEVAEAIDDVVKNNIIHLAEEVVDITIRADDLSGYLQRQHSIDPGQVKCGKMVVNEARPYKHGKLA